MRALPSNVVPFRPAAEPKGPPEGSPRWLLALFSDEAKARRFLEEARWPNGERCAHCESPHVRPLRRGPASSARVGLFKCYSCRQQFTVTVGTVFERSHLQLSAWLYILHLIAEAKKGISALEVKRRVGISYRTSWRACHAIRMLMTEMVLLEGDIEADETFLGRRRWGNSESGKARKNQSIIATVYARGSGKVRSTVVDSTRVVDLAGPVAEADTAGRLITDARPSYVRMGGWFGSGHGVVNKRSRLRKKEFTAHVDAYHSLIKAALRRTYNGVSPDYLPAYMVERDWHFNHRDDDRFALLVAAALGVRPSNSMPRE